MKCPNCNFEVAENTKFCPECGTKMLETNAESKNESSNTPSTDKLNDQKKAKKKKIKKILIISISALLACGIIFLILYLVNPFCMFGHESGREEGKQATCTEDGDLTKICDDCGDTIWSFHQYALGHNFEYKGVECLRCGEKRTCDEAYADHEYENAVCGQENTCVNCGEKEILQHYLYDGSCKYCGQDKFTVKLPTLPITVHEYDYSNNIEQSCVITQITVKPYSSGIEITYTVKRTYHEDGNNHSENTKIGWKLYDSDGTVIGGSTDYSDGTIKVGEQSKGSFYVYDLELWKEYRLEILSVS